MKIYFVRHSLRDNSVKEDAIAPLTEKGHQKAELLIEFFKNKKIDMIYASPYRRVLETVRPIAENLKLPIKQVDGLRERKIGYWVEDFYGYAQHQWQDFDFKLENGESLNEVQNRIVQTYHSIVEDKDYETLLIGGHGTAMSLLFNNLTKGRFNYNDFLKMKMPSVYLWDTEAEQLTHIQ